MKKAFKAHISYGKSHTVQRRFHLQPILHKGDRIGYVEAHEAVSVLDPITEYHSFAVTADQRRTLADTNPDWVFNEDWDDDDLFWVYSDSLEIFLERLNHTIKVFGADNRVDLKDKPLTESEL